MNEYYPQEPKINWKQAFILLAVTGIFALVASFLIINSRQETRDLKRLADIRIIQHALELYYHDCNRYPLAIFPGAPISGIEDCQGSLYLQAVPMDPREQAYLYIPCKDKQARDCASGLANPLSYQLYYELESNIENLPKGRRMAVPGLYAAR